MPHQEPGVDREALIDPVEILIERPPVPGARILHGAQRNSLHDSHHPLDIRGISGRQRRNRESAVAAQDGGHSVEHRRACGGVPQQLGVVVGVHIDEAGADHGTAEFDSLLSGFVGSTDHGDAPVTDRHICLERLLPGAVHNGGVSKDQIEHLSGLRESRRLRLRRRFL